MKKIVIQGLGFVGSAMAVAISSRLNVNNKPIFDVTGIDLPSGLGKQRINDINKGFFPLQTNDKEIVRELKKSVDRGNLTATHKKDSYSTADVVIVSINCDLIKDNGFEKIDLNSFMSSLCIIAENILEETLIIIESTVPPGTCEKLINPLFKKTFKKRGLDFNKFYLAHSYERVMPGDQYFNSIINYWRVFSGINDISSKKCETFLSQIININDFPLTKLNSVTASETGKVLENSYRAVNIAFIEEWGRFAEDAGVDLFEVIDAIRMRPTHSNIRQPGFGVGGYCLTKDPLFAKIAARDILNLNGHNFDFSSEAVKLNAKMPLVTLKKLKDHFSDDLQNINILLMGATYRQDIADTRFSPSEIFYNEAISEGANIKVHDPMIDYWEELNIKILSDLPKVVDFNVVVFAVPHKEYSKINMKKWLKGHKVLLFDANNVLSKEQRLEIKDNAINFMSIGRG